MNFNPFTLGGANASDFQVVVNTCYYGYYQARVTCYVGIQFIPPAGTTGPLSATLLETDAATPGSHTITLTGTAVTPGPAAAFSPSVISFAQQNVGSTSAPQNFSVTNTGSANLTVTAVASSNTTEFPVSLDGCSGTTLTPGSHCVIGVVFKPSYGGARSGSISVTDNATGSPQTVAVTGTSYGIPATAFNPTSLTFGNTNIGASSASQTITLTNPGTDVLVIGGNITLTGVHAGDYSQSNSCTPTLAPTGLVPAASCVITVTFKPTAAGTRGAYLTITDNANNIPSSVQNIPLTGTGVAVPTAVLSPVAGSTLTFGGTDIGVTSAAQTVTVTNSGTGQLTIAGLSIGLPGANGADFAETNNCGATLVVSSTCTISITFTPQAAGARTATLTITDNANNTGGSTQTISLSGSGVGLPAAALNTPSLNFSNQNVNSTSAAQTVTLSNSGTGPLTFAVSLTGANMGDFAETNSCAGTVAASGGTCVVSVTFTPTAIGSRSATLLFTDNAGNVANSTQSVSLTGIGVGVPAAAATPASIGFGTATVGTTTAVQMATVTNNGTGALTVSSVGITGSNATDFAITANTCTTGPVAASGGTCSISVTFTPGASGVRSGTLNISDNAGNTSATQTVGLGGTGVDAVATLSPSPVVFGNVNEGVTSGSQTITLTNSGTSTLAITNIALGGTNASDFAIATNNCSSNSVAASASCTILVTFTPGGLGIRAGTLTVTDNSGGTAGSTQGVALSGTGIGVPAASVMPGSLTFPATVVGNAAATQMVTVSNNGTGALSITNITIGGTNASDFTQTNNCGASLAVSASCSITVTFTPEAVGQRTANLHVVDNSGNGGVTQSVTLNGAGSLAASPGAAAVYTGLDTTTSGSWTGKYGANGYIIPEDTSSITPAYATVSVTSLNTPRSPYTWKAAGTTTDARALQVASGSSSRIATTYYSNTYFTADVNLTDGNPHRVALYLLDWDTTARTETVTIMDAATNSVLSTQAFSGFHNGQYASWNIQGHVHIQVTWTGGANAVLSGLFFDPILTTSASYAGSVDTTTKGTWTGHYGSNGYLIPADAQDIPPYATMIVNGSNTPYVWSNSSADVRNLQTANGTTTRIASAYYSSTNASFNIAVSVEDGNVHKISLYLLDWDTTARTETITITDAVTGAVLVPAIPFSNFHNGQYASFNVVGRINIQVTKTGGSNEVVSGIFID